MGGSGATHHLPAASSAPPRQAPTAPTAIPLTPLPGDSTASISASTITTTALPERRGVAAAEDTLQKDPHEGRTSSSRSRPQPDHVYPEVIVSAGVPSYPDPRTTYTHRSHARELENREDHYTFHRVPSPPIITIGSVTVRVEEICLVLVVLMLWAGAITLFINRWGKLRMLEPYQPAYTAPVVPPRPPPPPLGPCINIQSTSDLSMAEGGYTGSRYDLAGPDQYGRGSLTSGYLGYLGLERSPSCLSMRTLNPQRKVKSAVDLVSLVMQEKMSSNLSFGATNV